MSDGYTFKPERANRACTFFEQVLRHTMGPMAGEAFKLADWQAEEIIRPLFGTLRADGTRRYRRVFVAIPRKNGKSTLAAGVALYLLCADGEASARVYSAAGDKDQARIVFGQAEEMVNAAPDLRRRLEPYRNVITHPASGSKYQVLSADAPGKHGLNAHGVIFDELHVQPNRRLWDVLMTSTGARPQPVILAMTTAGHDRHSICWEVWQHALAVLEGRVEDPSFLPVVYGAEKEADWLSPATWHAANPNLGVSLRTDYIEEEAARAAEMPGAENTFRQLHLNQWTEQATRWLQMALWDECAGPRDHAELAAVDEWWDRPCFGGLDLARERDLSALVLYFVGDESEPAVVVPYFWCDEDTLLERVRRDRVPYDRWAQQGLIELTPGNVTDFDFIEERIRQLWDQVDLREIAYDRTFAGQLVNHLNDDGVVMVPHGQGYMAMARPTAELGRQVRGACFHHGSHPILRWMAGNVIVRKDAAGNLKPDKERSTERIDGIVSLVMAISRATLHTESGSVYDHRDPVVI